MLEGILAVFTLQHILLIAGGTVIGIIFGSIPGLTATMALAIFLPLTFALDVTPSIAFLISLYVGGISGGLISAILIGIPGTPSSVATTFDGAPMARRGEAGKALGVAIFASTVGTLVSTAALMTVAPLLARFALMFGPFEYFSVCFFALMVLSCFVSDSFLKGFTMSVFGVLVSLVGVSPVGSAIRFTFGVPELVMGFRILPVMIGLFAVAEILQTSENRPTVENTEVMDKVEIRGLGFKIKDLSGQFVNFVRSILIGIGIGILPGIGGAAGNVIAYSAAKQSDKNPEKFGTGCVDGIIASEASNNAVIGGAMIPLLTLSIPGDAPTAILLGGLMIAGITPGPLLFVNNTSFLYSVYTALILSTIVMFLVQIFGIKLFVKVLSIPKYYLLPVIMAMCVVGVLADNSQIFDVTAAIIFGVIGYLMTKYKFPASPFILGFLLGAIIETHLIRMMQYSRNNIIAGFMDRPIALVFMGITFLVCTMFAVGKIRKSKAASAQ